MARTILLIGAAIWLLAGAAGIGAAAIGTRWLLSLLPPLAIDADALGGALAAIALALVAVGLVHVVVLVGLRRRRRWAQSAGTLLGAVLAIASLALAATALASANREAPAAVILVPTSAGAALAAIGYGLVAVRMLRELTSDAAI